ncbi:hypothetical protein ACO0QE_002653 [Hanseniaspora vineae]
MTRLVMRYTATNENEYLEEKGKCNQSTENLTKNFKSNISNPNEQKLSPEIISTLKQKTIEAQTFAYAPYSNFKVGCCLLVKTPPLLKHSPNAKLNKHSYDYITGCNVENAAFPACVCAERTAICKAISMGYRDFEAICVVGGIMSSDTKSNKKFKRIEQYNTLESFVTPCGVCRQFIREFVSKDFPVYLLSNENDKDNSRPHEIMTIDELLPYSFGPGDLH